MKIDFRAPCRRVRRWHVCDRRHGRNHHHRRHREQRRHDPDAGSDGRLLPPSTPTSRSNWVTLEENVLRQNVTTDIATKGGQYDVMTIGTYEVPIWGKQGWLLPLDDLPASYDVGDILPAIRGGLTVDGKLYAAPFYGESSMVMYRTDLMKKAGLEMPEVADLGLHRQGREAMTDKSAGIYGICLRGKAGWGENMAFLTAMSNSLRRALVRHGLETAVRQRGVEGHARPPIST